MAKNQSKSPEQQPAPVEQSAAAVAEPEKTRVTPPAEEPRDALRKPKPKFHFSFDFVVKGEVKTVEVDANTEAAGMAEAVNAVHEKFPDAGTSVRYAQNFTKKENE